MAVQFNAKKLKISLPDAFYFAVNITEIIKQIGHTSQWLKKEYLESKRRHQY